MSETQAKAEPSHPPAPTEPKPKKRRRWRRRLLWVAGVVLSLRIGLGLCMPWILNMAVGDQLQCDYENLKMSLLTGWVEIRQLELRRKSDSEGTSRPIVALEYAELDLVSDERFAQAFCRQRLSRHYGPIKIRAELRKR